MYKTFNLYILATALPSGYFDQQKNEKINLEGSFDEMSFTKEFYVLQLILRIVLKFTNSFKINRIKK